MSVLCRLIGDLHVGKTQDDLKKLVKMVKLGGTFHCCVNKRCIGRKNIIEHLYGGTVHETYKIDRHCEPSVGLLLMTDLPPPPHPFFCTY